MRRMIMAKKLDQLSEELVNSLQGEKIVTLVTLDKETKLPHMSVVSWLVAQPGGKQIKFALGHKGTSVDNILTNAEVILGVYGEGSYHAVRGNAAISDIIEKSMKYRVVTVEIESVEDVIFYGGKITVEPEYTKTYNPELAKKLDEEVYSLLKG
jgi:hypothetical protein